MMQEFVQQFTDTVKRCIRDVHTAMPGKILAFDPDKCIATVQPALRFKKPDGTTIAYPQVTGVPVVFPQGAQQEAVIAFPVKAGDGCLLVVAEQSLDYWQYGQETGTDLAFDLTNAICIPGLFTKAHDAIKEACESNAVVIEAKGTRITIKEDEVAVDAKEVKINGNLTVSGSISGG